MSAESVHAMEFLVVRSYTLIAFGDKRMGKLMRQRWNILLPVGAFNFKKPSIRHVTTIVTMKTNEVQDSFAALSVGKS